MTVLTVNIGSAQGRDYVGLAQAWAGTPQDLVAQDISVLRLLFNNDSEFNIGNQPVTLDGKNTDANHRIEIVCAPGASYLDNANLQTNALHYNTANGVGIVIPGTYNPGIVVNNSYVTISGLQFNQTSDDGFREVIRVAANLTGVVVADNIIDSQGSGSNHCGLFLYTGTARNNTIILYRDGHGINLDYGLNVEAYNNTVVRSSRFNTISFGGVGILSNVGGAGGGVKVANNAIFGFQQAISTPDATGFVSNATDCATISGTGLTGLVFANQFVSSDNDFRLKAGSGLIDAGTPTPYLDSANNTTRQSGLAYDVGAWEYPSAIHAPSAVVTSIVVNGQTATISGTTASSPTGGTMALHPTSAAGNHAVEQAPINLTLGTGTFTATFNNLPVGKYTVDYSVSNQAYTAAGSNPIGEVNVVGAYAATLVQDDVDGQLLTIHGTTSGSPVSGMLTVPADPVTPLGAVDVQANVTLGAGTFTVTATLKPGNYLAGLLTFTTAAGTSLPQPGTSAVNVVSIYGSPQADQGTPDTVAPVLDGALNITNVTASGFTLGWQAATDDVGVARYEYSLDNGGTWTTAGSSTSYAVTGKSANTPYTALLRAVDFGDNHSNTITASTTTLAVSVPSSRAVMLSMVTSAALAPAANLSNLRWAWFDQATPNLFGAPTDQGTLESTDANGVLTISLPNSGLSIGGVGWLIITDSSGNPAQTSNAFSGPVMVA